MTHHKVFEEPPDNSNEGVNRFYDRKNPDDEIAGLEFAIKRTKYRIENDQDRPDGVFEEHLKSMEKELEKAKARKEMINDLERDIEATKTKMAESGTSQDLASHLRDLEQRLETAKNI